MTAPELEASRGVFERVRTEQGAHESERLLGTITGSLPVLVAYVGTDKRYRFVNACYERWFHQPAASFLGKHMVDVLGEHAYRRIEPHVVSALAGRTTTYEALVPYREGGERHIRATYVPDLGEDGQVRGFTALVSDVGEQKRLEASREAARAQAETAANRLAISYAVAETIIAAEQADDVFRAALDAIEQGLDTKRAAILVCDRDGVMRFRAWRQLSNDYRAAVEGHSPWRPDDRQPEPIVIGDVSSEPGLAAFRQALEREGIAALAFIPLVANARLVGKFVVYFAAPRALAPAELNLARALAHHVAAAVARFDAILELERTVKFNEMFTAVLGHDLRNPLNAIMAAAQLVLLGTKNEKQTKQLSRIVNSGARMSRMIDQLLDFTRVRVGQGIPLRKKELDLAQLVKQVVDEIETAEPACAVNFEFRGDTRGSWDEDRLAQIFSNLLGNAVQHRTGECPVDVRLDGAGPEVVVTIHNEGSIPPELLGRLFEPMAGGEQRRAKSQGLGLGLFISRQIAKGHGGKIEVTSGAGGTTFSLSLPRGTPDEERSA